MHAPPDDSQLPILTSGEHLSNLMPTQDFLNGSGNRFNPVLKMIVEISHSQKVSNLARTSISSRCSIRRLNIRISCLTNHRNLLIFHAGPNYPSSLVDQYCRISQLFILAGRSNRPLTYARSVPKTGSAYKSTIMPRIATLGSPPYPSGLTWVDMLCRSRFPGIEVSRIQT